MSGYLDKYFEVKEFEKHPEWKLRYYILSNIGLLEFLSLESEKCEDFIPINEFTYICGPEKKNNFYEINIIRSYLEERIMFRLNNLTEAQNWCSELHKTQEGYINTKLNTLKL